MRVCVQLLCALLITAFVAANAAHAANNVLVFVADDLGPTLGCYGDPNAKTPRVDEFAKSATMFPYAFCTTASCSPSRSVILSGMQNHANGMYGLEHSDHHFRSQENLRTLPNVLNDAGYRTACLGKYHVGPEPTYHFGEYPKIPGGNRSPAGFAKALKEFINVPSAGKPAPFFAYVCSIDPHRAGANGYGNDGKHEGDPVVKFDPAAIKVPAYLPDRAETRGDLADYYQAVARLDATFGAVLDVLRETGHDNDTLVIFMSDNGIPFPGAKTTQYDPGTNLPLLVRKPGQQNAGKTNTAMVTWADLAPTILDFAGQKAPNSMQGRSFLAVSDAASPAGWDEIFTSHTFHEVTMYYPMRSVRTRTHKLIMNLAHPLAFPTAGDLYGSPTWQAALLKPNENYGLRTFAQYTQRPQYELYDLTKDPGEAKNLADDPAHAEQLKELQGKLKAYQKSTKDPWMVKYTHE
jgi:N-sulfoglucosamine sulfohydrolase